ncbi:MAG: hypothetical protein ACPL3C_03995 [Pyrobaculum sp.]
MKASAAQTLAAAAATLLLFYPVLQIILLSVNKLPYFRLGGDFIPTLESFQWVLQQSEFWRGLANSLVVSLSTVAMVIALALPGAYAFSRYRFRGRGPPPLILRGVYTDGRGAGDRRVDSPICHSLRPRA